MTEHLDDGILSAAIDGEAPARALDHVTSCPACAGRLAALRMVASTVSASGVQPTPEEASRAVTVALDAALAPDPAARWWASRRLQRERQAGQLQRGHLRSLPRPGPAATSARDVRPRG